MIFSKGSSGGIGIISVNGRGGVRQLLQRNGALLAPLDLSPDGKHLMYVDLSTTADLWVKPMEGEGKPFAYLDGPFNETSAAFSPDGKWVAYNSDESGTYEVYVRPFPPGPGKWKVSSGAGISPRWSPDGKELYYVAPGDMIIPAAVNARGSSLEVSGTKGLFASQMRLVGRVANAPSGVFQVSPDGKRFLLNLRLKEAEAAPLTVAVHWLEGVKR